MKRPEAQRIQLHEDPDLFAEAVNYTAAESGFAGRLVEKDYFCSVLLQYLAASAPELVFKGGTCLTKVHAGFYRLSEDLDFVIPMATGASRAHRSSQASGSKRVINRLEGRLPGFRLIAGPSGANESIQYNSMVGYKSLIGTGEEAVRIEVGLREPLLAPLHQGLARTMLLNPVSGMPAVPEIAVGCISSVEAFAEKLRAALSRREVAIRDFYDIDHAVRTKALELNDPELHALLREKLSVPGNIAVDGSDLRIAELRAQVEPRLKPVLRVEDFAQFDLERAFGLVKGVAALVALPPNHRRA